MLERAAHWEHFTHDADMGIRGIGCTLAAAFEQAGTALTAVICDPARVEPRVEIEITCEGHNLDFLFMNWIDALVYEMATRHMLFGDFDVRFEDGRLRARVRGERIDIARHRPAVEVKGATLTQLEVASDDKGRWHAQCVIDV